MDLKTKALWDLNEMGVCNACLEKLANQPGSETGFSYNDLCERCRMLPKFQKMWRAAMICRWVPDTIWDNWPRLANIISFIVANVVNRRK